MNVFKFELKSNLKSSLIWILVLCGVAYFFMMIFPAYLENSAGILEILKKYPPELLKALGMDIDQFFTALGFYSFVLVYIELIAAMQAMMLGLGCSGREIRTKTSDFLITKPIKRWQILLAKVSVVFLILIVTNILLSITSVIALNQVATTSFSMTALLLVNISTFLLQLIFASLGILLGVVFRKLRSVAPVSLGIVFGFFVVNMLKAIFNDAWIQYVSPFQFFEKYVIIATQSFNLVMLLWCLLLIFGFSLLSFIIYTNKDIHAV